MVDSEQNVIQIILQVKRDIAYSSRMVQVRNGQLKYSKENEPNKIRFQASLEDIILIEKNINDKREFKIILNSKTNSFPLVKMKHSDYNILLNFKNQLERLINIERNKKNNKTNILMKVNKEEPSGIIHELEKKIASDIKRISNKHELKSEQVLESPEYGALLTRYGLKENLLDPGKFDQIVKAEYKLIKFENGVLIASTSVEAVRNNSSMSPVIGEINDIRTAMDSETVKKKHREEYLSSVLSLLLIVFIGYHIYMENYIHLLFAICTKFLFQKELNEYSIGLLGILNLKSIFKSLYCGKDETPTSCLILGPKWSDPIFVKSSTIAMIGVLDLIEKIIVPGADAKFTLFKKLPENSIYIYEERGKEKFMNLYILQPNEKYSKTKIEIYSVLKCEYPKIQWTSSVTILENLVSSLKMKIDESKYFPKSDKDKQSEYLNIQELLFNISDKTTTLPMILPSNASDIQIKTENRKTSYKAFTFEDSLKEIIGPSSLSYPSFDEKYFTQNIIPSANDIISLPGRKIYKTSTQLNISPAIVTTYLQILDNRKKFNRYLKEITLLKEINRGTYIHYLICDYKIFPKPKDYVVVEEYKEITLDQRHFGIIFIQSLHSTEINELTNISADRGMIWSSGYYVESISSDSCNVGYWIEVENEISNESDWMSLAMRNYIKHLHELGENIIFDLTK